jgi:6-phosphogluconolactonase
MTGIVDVVNGSAEQLAREFVRRTSALAAVAMRERQCFALAIPGGSVVERLVGALRMAEIDWANVDLFWCDERCVPPGDPESNFFGARRHLLDALGASGPRVHRMRGEDDDHVFAAHRYGTDLEATLGVPPVLDLVLLGVGEDGHVCSLFPGHRALDELVNWVVVETASPKPPPVRLTITLPVIAAARHVAVAAFGSTKAAVVREALDDRESSLPVALALRGAARATIYLDDAAAAMLHSARRSSGALS